LKNASPAACELTTAIPLVRQSVAALLRIHGVKAEAGARKKGARAEPKFRAVIGGSAFCIVADRYLVTAWHVLNGGKPRNPDDLLYLLTVPDNGDQALCFPVRDVPFERRDLDVAVLEIGPCATTGGQVPALPVSFAPRPDGTRVVTVGYPSPTIARINLDASGSYRGGEMFLKSHANEGIVAAQYKMGGVSIYELNIGWHNGESGGPVAVVAERPAAFSLMQHYRNIQSPHGILPGPHRGCALSGIQAELLALGAEAVE
jgi:hypothetical protein